MLLVLCIFTAEARGDDTPSFIAEWVSPATESLLKIYEDAEYRFAGHGYGRSGEDSPSFFAFNKHVEKWIRISQVSTRNAVFGRSPDIEKTPLMVGWDHSSLAGQAFVDFPLVTGAVLLPDKIEFDQVTDAYRIYVGSQYREDAQPTIFLIPKRDLDEHFEGKN